MLNARFSMVDQGSDGGLRNVGFRGAGFLPQTSRYAGLAAIVLVIGLWQLAGSLSLFNPVFLPTPLSILRALIQLALSGALWQHLAYSILRIGSGWLLGTAAGIIIGFA